MERNRICLVLVVEDPHVRWG